MEKQEKEKTRERVRQLIGALSGVERTEKSKAACENLIAARELRDARAILLYAPLPDELDVWPALRALAGAGKRVVLPKCRPEKRELLCIEIEDPERDLVRGTFNILEPRSDNGISPEELDVVVAPGRAFDREGNRVGRGAGYYDRLFLRPGFRAFICGAAFDCQVFPKVPAGDLDVPVHAIATESGLIRVDGPGRAPPGYERRDDRAASKTGEEDQGG